MAFFGEKSGVIWVILERYLCVNAAKGGCLGGMVYGLETGCLIGKRAAYMGQKGG